MPMENVEVARGYLTGYGRDGPTELSALVAGVWDPYGDYYPVEKFPESRPCHGVNKDCALSQRVRTGLGTLRVQGQGDHPGP